MGAWDGESGSLTPEGEVYVQFDAVRAYSLGFALPPRPWRKWRIRFLDCCCSSVVERVLGKDEVMGSSPISS